jgi:hypothetical protein
MDIDQSLKFAGGFGGYAVERVAGRCAIVVLCSLLMGQRLQKISTPDIWMLKMFVVYARPKATSPDIPAEACASLRCLLSWWYCFVHTFIGIPVSLQRSGYQVQCIVKGHVIVRLFNGNPALCVRPVALVRGFYRDFHLP